MTAKRAIKLGGLIAALAIAPTGCDDGEGRGRDETAAPPPRIVGPQRLPTDPGDFAGIDESTDDIAPPYFALAQQVRQALEGEGRARLDAHYPTLAALARALQQQDRALASQYEQAGLTGISADQRRAELADRLIASYRQATAGATDDRASPGGNATP
mgnify:CR=1